MATREFKLVRVDGVGLCLLTLRPPAGLLFIPQVVRVWRDTVE
jgi:hypothetical protein